MIQVDKVQAVRSQISQWKQAGLKVGFVPTMGNLHNGHLSLVGMAQKHADKVVVSIFVNPLQFGPNEDFASYPRTLDEDCGKLSDMNVDMVFFPSVEEMYPEKGMDTLVKASESLGGLWEGAARPGHFDGVTTVVTKLFNIVMPDIAVFGQKDFQQWRIIHQMVMDLSMPVEVLRAPIARDVDGLALSSRNQYLSKVQREIAPKLFVALQDVASAILSGNQIFDALAQAAEKQLLEYGFDAVDYIQIVDNDTLKPVENRRGGVVVLAVVRLGSTRLLDNICID